MSVLYACRHMWVRVHILTVPLQNLGVDIRFFLNHFPPNCLNRVSLEMKLTDCPNLSAWTGSQDPPVSSTLQRLEYMFLQQSLTLTRPSFRSSCLQSKHITHGVIVSPNAILISVNKVFYRLLMLWVTLLLPYKRFTALSSLLSFLFLFVVGFPYYLPRLP